MGYRVLVFATRFFFFSVFVSLSHSCPEGYYGSPCTPCPFSTYKDFSGDAASCKPCPTNSGHQRLGSIYIQDCRCLTGYEGSPEHGLSCTIRRCELLSPPENGAFQGNCFNVYSSECRMKCHEGYEAVGSMERKCVVNQNDIMVWSGTPMSCAVIQCPFYQVPFANPPTGVCNSVYLEYNTRCIFTCLTGYRLKGSKERVCQLDKTWSGTPTTCEEITCPKLSPVQPWVSLIPSECATGPMSFYSLCSFRCPNGFAVQGHPSSVAATPLLCQLNGTWSESVPTCYDYQPPQFLKCPGQSGSIVTETQKGKAAAKVFWTIQVTDNSVREDPNAVIQVQSSHEPGQEFPIGGTSIRITATDQAGNSAWCAFSIHVKDTEPPSCSSCPPDIVQEETTHEVRVFWEDPVCSDNSGISPTIISSRRSGATFSVPSSSTVHYTVSDGVNDNRNCSFRITLKEKSCPKRLPPRNGALACTTFESPVCAVFCKSGTDFEFNPPMLYFCSAGKWDTYSFTGIGDKNIPNCSASASPSWIKMFGFPWYYYGGSGDANDPNVQAVIKSQFITLMKSSGLVPPLFCTMKPNCNEANISVTPGAKG